MPYLKTPKKIDWNYEIDGQGEPLIFLHGWGGDLRLWSAQAEHFSRCYQVIRIDLPGHGKSGWEKTTLRAMARDLEKILQGMNCPSVNIVGSSMGGLIALQWFDFFPERFKRIVFVGALPKFLMNQSYPYGLELDRLRKLDGQLEVDYPLIVNVFFRSLFTRQERESCKDALQCVSTAFSAKDALREFLKILEKEDLRGTLEKINKNSIPVQILNGADDYICSKDAVGYLQKKLPRARVELFKDCGHFPFLTKPREFNEALDKFLKEGLGDRA